MEDKSINLLILGSSGFIGQNLVEQLSEIDDFNICGVDKRSPEHITPKDFVIADVSNVKLLKEIVLNFVPNYIINLAATTDLGVSSEDYYKENVIIVENLIEILSEFKEIKLIHFSSMLADSRLQKRHTHNSAALYYGKSKRVGELLLIENGFVTMDRTIILRPTSIWGKYFKEPYVDFFKLIKKGRYLNIGLKRFKSFGYINTVVDQVSEILKNKFVGNIYVVGDKEPYELEAFSKKISASFQVREPFVINKIILVLISRILSGLLNDNRNPLPTTRVKNLLDPIVYLPEEFDYVPVSSDLDLDSSVENVASWLGKTKV
jgi:GlcNAc-P-P-Und epimerase